jgi:hypothetical protein
MFFKENEGQDAFGGCFSEDDGDVGLCGSIRNGLTVNKKPTPKVGVGIIN